ncbi:SDR family NAD(P)-dependent oxidoreductase [Chachezhania sediminis]|uniref:SDR family NAD(P)-dependent oxidoreductase n=1 Tax=Chachezhania sediminis TaxID=2599291 RepID=UPI0018EF2967|nr:SDR family NAD(P)-dependent oxidoreductase [Chachezhania sediminis]
MTSMIRFDGRVAIVTGAGNGLGRAHALGLAARGARVVVNDLGGDGRGDGGSVGPAEAVAEEIRANGGQAIADGADVSDPAAVQAMVDRTMAEWGRVDILLNNAGITRDASFGKMALEDFRKVVDVHLTGSMICTRAVWNIMRDQEYGRVLLTSSTSGLYGAFAQAHYAAAKSAMLGLMNVLQIEGGHHNIRVNMLAPWAATRLTAGLLPQEMLDRMRPELVTPAVLYLLGEDAPERVIIGAGSGSFSRIQLVEGAAIHLAGDQCTPEALAARFDEMSAAEHLHTVTDTFEQNRALLAAAEQA